MKKFMTKKTFKCFLLFTCYLLLSSTAFADELKVSGFGTIVATISDSQQYAFRNDMSQNDGAKKDEIELQTLSNLGLQLNYSFNEKWDAVGQFVYREQEPSDLDSLTQLAFIRYKPTPNWHFRVGRTALDIFQFSEVRDVNIAYPWVKVPTEVYGLIPNRNADGVDVSYISLFENFTMTSKLFYGKTKSDFSSGSYEPIRFENLVGASILVESFDWRLGFRLSQGKAQNNTIPSLLVVDAIKSAEMLWPGASEFANDVDITGKVVQYASVYASTFAGPLEISAEMAYVNSDSIAISDISNGFFNISYPFDAHTFYFKYSFADTDEYYFSEPVLSRELLAPLIFAVEEVGSTFSHNQNSLSFGWRWDFSETLAFKLQYERTKVDARGGGLRLREGYVTEGDSQAVNTVFAAMSFSF